MKIITRKWFQLSSVFLLGMMLGVWQYIPAGKFVEHGVNNSQDKRFLSQIRNTISNTDFNEKAYKNTADIEALLNVKAPEKSASVNEWYRFALSLDDIELGKRYSNSGTTTILLGWYAYIAKYKPEALYKLYNQGKLGGSKFEHLLQFGFLKYWDESINDVDKLLLDNRQAVLTLAYSKGADQVRKRIAQAFFKEADKQTTKQWGKRLRIENLLFAIKGMTTNEKKRILPILKRDVFQIDPREFYRLKLTKLFSDSDISLLIEQYAKQPSYSQRMMSGYMADGAMLGNEKYIKIMTQDLEDNAKQPTNFYCAACGLALSTDGLVGYPLINAAKKGKVIFSKDSNGAVILSRKSGW